MGGVAFGVACSGASTEGFGSSSGGTSSGSSNGGSSSGASSSSGSSSGTVLGASSSGGSSSSGSSSGTVTSTTVYAHTNTQIYTLDPKALTISLVGSVTGLASGDSSITDLAVNAAGDVYVNSETNVYKATLPSSGTGSVALQLIHAITVGKGQYFYALAFTPKDALGAGTGEVLIGGDGNGELWSIDPSSGATKDLGSFGNDPADSTITMGLSGDLVFYMDSSGKPTGLATIRGCAGTKGCSSTSSTYTTDYLVGVDMTALASAYSGSPGTSLNAGFYGAASSSDKGPGIGYKEVFGLGAWNGSVFGFTHTAPIALLTIGTSGSGAGAGTVAGNTSSSGWAGAGVTSTVTVTVAPPPIPPK